ncbi:DegT/DnrJ/EryC1/StrS family aminotransferase [Brevibacillus centrosporus]|uniref:DegT/DnrJ/EryC1/StrS family aminotransferase n=1 Tax=Brevibacillus centrosporus TaxID=54910 RepID=UPI0015879655|nr:DegT/DnrJ/EryC1/StrS family aminotransferase [Brevibacillus centrosporus]
MKEKWPIIDEEDKKRVMECLEEGRLWRGNGKYIFELEKQFANLHETKYALAVTNGTHALEIALEAAGIGYGDEVLIPAYTFIATATAVLMRNALPIPIEVDADNFCMDPLRIEECITERTKAIIPVHISGHSCDMDPLMEVARKYNLVVIEDCAHSQASKYKNRSLGSIGEFGTFSFQAVKTMTAGEGGMLTMNNEDYWRKAFNFFNCGRQPEGPSYNHVSLSSNYRMSEIQAALLVGQINRVEAQLVERNSKVKYLNSLLQEIEGIIPQGRAEYATHQGYSMYMFRYKKEYFNGLSREDFINELNKAGFPAFRTYPVFFKTKFFENIYQKYSQLDILPNKRDYTKMNFPISNSIADEVIWLPHFFLLSDESELKLFKNSIQSLQIRNGVAG